MQFGPEMKVILHDRSIEGVEERQQQELLKEDEQAKEVKRRHVVKTHKHMSHHEDGPWRPEKDGGIADDAGGSNAVGDVKDAVASVEGTCALRAKHRAKDGAAAFGAHINEDHIKALREEMISQDMIALHMDFP